MESRAMIAEEYFNKLYTIKPIPAAADITNDAICMALRVLNFELGREYILYISRAYLEFIPRLTNGIVNIKIYLIDPSIEDQDFWYIICPTTKTIVYSPGA